MGGDEHFVRIMNRVIRSINFMLLYVCVRQAKTPPPSPFLHDKYIFIQATG